ncbi:MAG: 3-dehydroquinate synthase [Candidatus Omnitrophica bacterium]|nr:3-dehydroquinate synthase [Candidatus Omnitrophota bacterium]
MKKEIIQSMHGAYTVMSGSGLISKAGALISAPGILPKGVTRGKTKVLVVSQEVIFSRYGKTLLKSLQRAGFKVFKHIVPNGEKAKTQTELFRLYQVLLESRFDRSDVVLGLGGGVIGDLCGFAASTYLRGLAFVNVTTTLLGQVDSAVGGKTAINLPEGKNLIGTFYPARLVLADASVLKTLPERDFHASLAEIVKYGVIRDIRLFRQLERDTKKILNRDQKVLASIIHACVRIKARVAERDERETKGERMILNYGHTFAHAFEKAANYEDLRHGEAVSIGMAAAGKLAVRLGLWPRTLEERQEKLLRALRLPVCLDGFSFNVSDLLRAMQHDKKRSSGKLRFVLPVRIGKVIVREDIAPKMIEQILRDVGGKV